MNISNYLWLPFAPEIPSRRHRYGFPPIVPSDVNPVHHWQGWRPQSKYVPTPTSPPEACLSAIPPTEGLVLFVWQEQQGSVLKVAFITGFRRVTWKVEGVRETITQTVTQGIESEKLQEWVFYDAGVTQGVWELVSVSASYYNDANNNNIMADNNTPVYNVKAGKSFGYCYTSDFGNIRGDMAYDIVEPYWFACGGDATFPVYPRLSTQETGYELYGEGSEERPVMRVATFKKSVRPVPTLPLMPLIMTGATMGVTVGGSGGVTPSVLPLVANLVSSWLTNFKKGE